MTTFYLIAACYTVALAVQRLSVNCSRGPVSQCWQRREQEAGWTTYYLYNYPEMVAVL